MRKGIAIKSTLTERIVFWILATVAVAWIGFVGWVLYLVVAVMLKYLSG